MVSERRSPRAGEQSDPRDVERRANQIGAVRAVGDFDEGLEQVRLLLEKENVSAQGRFHSFDKVTSLPRPTQKPRPPFWIAALSTRESFENAGTLGHYLMGIPLAGAHMASLLQTYRDAWTAAGHDGRGKVMLAFHMYCADTSAKAAAVAREPLNQYLKSIVDAASGVSGAGREVKENTAFNTVDGSLAAYGLLNHRHTAEMEMALGGNVLFTPHLQHDTAEFIAVVDKAR